MPTRTTNMRLGDELLTAARRALKLPDDAPITQVVRAALQRVAGDPAATGEAVYPTGRPKGWKPGQRYTDLYDR